MERIASPEERLRRAEEIYYRRKLNSNDVRMPSSNLRGENQKRQFSLYKKMAIQILICILIYLIFSLIKEANYLFSDDVVSKVQEFLSTDINFEVLSSQTENFFKDNQDKFAFFTQWFEPKEEQKQNSENQNEGLVGNQIDGNQEENNNTVQNNNSEAQNQETVENSINTEKNQTEKNEVENTGQEDNKNVADSNLSDNQNKDTNTQNSDSKTGIGGDNNSTVETSADDSSKKTQMQLDAEYIKKNFDLTLPANAWITSHYGKREPTEIISENHQGIDLGVVVGTNIVAAMDGKVSVVSDEGDYGTHVKIVNKDVTTIYAHCSKILVKKGETVKKGQKVALSGNTGNTTGPHLHFEIRRNNRTVDPELILKWT